MLSPSGFQRDPQGLIFKLEMLIINLLTSSLDLRLEHDIED